MGKHVKKEYSVQCVEHALDLLELYKGGNTELGVTALSRMMKLPKNKVFRLLSTLKSWNYIEQNQQTENYRLGFKTIELRQSYVRHMKRFDSVRTLLEYLGGECNETVCYSVLDRYNVLTLDIIDSAQVFRASPQVGASLPAHCTAAGKVMLSQLADDEREKYLSSQKFERFTPRTIVEVPRLRKELQDATLRGYAVARDEMSEGMSSVASIIRDHTEGYIGAVSLVLPTARLTEERLAEKFIPLLLGVTARISGKLGYCSVGSRGQVPAYH